MRDIDDILHWCVVGLAIIAFLLCNAILVYALIKPEVFQSKTIVIMENE